MSPKLSSNSVFLFLVALATIDLSRVSQLLLSKLPTSNGGEDATSSETKNSTQTHDTTWNVKEWNRHAVSSNCFFIENVCRGSDGRWFYRTDQSKRQPPVILKRLEKAFRSSGFANSSDIMLEYHESRDSKYSQCHESPIENHLVLFSLYNSMLGEFYVRGLFFLWQLYQSFPSLVKTSQLYLHLHDPTRLLLQSHHLFTQPFRTTPLLDFAADLVDDRSGCQCMKRVIFCGYHQHREGTASSFNRTDAEMFTTILEPGGRALPRAPTHGTKLFSHFRDFLRQEMVVNSPEVRKASQTYRRKLLSKHNISQSVSSGERWRIVGLAQRGGRRKWRDLDSVMQSAQNALWESHILLDIVNLDESQSDAFEQVATHAALDGLIGIHGAQLTEAIWMKPKSTVVELLPYIPPGVLGDWTKRTDQPTPLGVIFDNTDLNHVGLPLDRHSAPYCHDDSPKQSGCWHVEHPWDSRDFVLGVDVLVNFVKLLLVDQPDSCAELQRKIGTHVVPYNVRCTENGTVAPHHYYW